jgi:hypothetical protein
LILGIIRSLKKILSSIALASAGIGLILRLLGKKRKKIEPKKENMNNNGKMR